MEENVNSSEATLANSEQQKTRLRALNAGDIESIISEEREAWTPELQAARETMLKRLANGHKIIGIEEGGKLAGKVCFSYSDFSPGRPEDFPKNFGEYSMQAKTDKFNSAFIYNVDVAPDFRGKQYASKLFNAAEEMSSDDGCDYLVVDGRPSAYNRNSVAQESVSQNSEFKNAIDRYLAGGSFPSEGEFAKDKTIGMYQKFGCKPLWVLRNFLKDDMSSGGIRVIMYKDIGKAVKDKATLS